MWISHIEIYSKKIRVGYQTNFPVIQLHDYSLVTSLMRNKDAHKCARALHYVPRDNPNSHALLGLFPLYFRATLGATPTTTWKVCSTFGRF